MATYPGRTSEAGRLKPGDRVTATSVQDSRPERRDPPTRLLKMAMDVGCLFSLDTDAHAPGQLEFQIYGCQRAQDLDLDPARVINTWPVDELLDWCAKA